MKDTASLGHIPQVGSRVAKSVISVSLAPRQVLTLTGNRTGVQILAQGGALWITQCGDPDDHVVAAGQRFTIDRPGPVVVQSLPPQRVNAWGDRL